MGQLLVTLIVPPIVGLVTYIIVRRIWERDANSAEAVSRREPSAVTRRKRYQTVHKRIAMKVCRPLISLPNFLFVAISSVYWQAAGGQCPLWVKSRHVQRKSRCLLSAKSGHCQSAIL